MLILRNIPPVNSLYFCQMISVVILGTGNVAQNLAEAFFDVPEINLLSILGRSNDSLTYFKDKFSTSTDWTSIPEADIYVIAVKDDAIQEVSNSLEVEGLVVHTSGSVSLDSLTKHKSRGVFYPLQSFTAGKILDFNEIPLCLEVTNDRDQKLLTMLSESISSKVRFIDSEKRKVLHLAAVFVNNFTNYMYTIGSEICEKNQIDFSILHALIKETAAKVETMSPSMAQTGPAKRNDLKTLHGHLQLLKDEKQKDIYKLVSNAIKAANENEEKL